MMGWSWKDRDGGAAEARTRSAPRNEGGRRVRVSRATGLAVIVLVAGSVVLGAAGGSAALAQEDIFARSETSLEIYKQEFERLKESISVGEAAIRAHKDFTDSLSSALARLEVAWVSCAQTRAMADGETNQVRKRNAERMAQRCEADLAASDDFVSGILDGLDQVNAAIKEINTNIEKDRNYINQNNDLINLQNDINDLTVKTRKMNDSTNKALPQIR